MIENTNKFWFFIDKEIPDITKVLEETLQLPEYYHDLENTWEWCESVIRRFNFIENLKKYYDYETLKKMYGEDCLKPNKDCYIDEHSNDIYFDICREHNWSHGIYDKPVIFIIEKFPQNYTLKEFDLIGKKISNKLQVDVFWGEVHHERQNGKGIAYDLTPLRTFKYDNVNKT